MLLRMFKRQTTGSVVCASCGSLVGVNDETCYSCGRRNPGLWGFGPMLRTFGNDLGFVALVVYGCSALYVISLIFTVANGGDIMGSGSLLGMLAPAYQVELALGAAGAEPVFLYHRWWTVLSASWLHGNALHILFNVLWIRQLGPTVADIYGPGRMVIIYTVSGAVGFTISSFAGYYLHAFPIPILRGAMLTLGASAPIFGLLGALVHYGSRGGSSSIRSEALGYAVTLGIMGFIFQGVDNYAHFGGFVGGYLASAFLDPLRKERMDHLVLAAVCMILTALAILASAVQFYPLLIG
jgi:rhomboid protease GluP